jgi:DNA-directed RNA polymerase specialized sigma24 family protein
VWGRPAALAACRTAKGEADQARSLCTVVGTFQNQCFALAGPGWSIGADEEAAQVEAVAKCRSSSCTLKKSAAFSMSSTTQQKSASLENAIRADMHPADQYEAFAKLHGEGMSPEDIAARFGVTSAVVKQRLKLAAVSPNRRLNAL